MYKTTQSQRIVVGQLKLMTKYVMCFYLLLERTYEVRRSLRTFLVIYRKAG